MGRLRLSGSSPLASEITGIHGRRCGEASVSTARMLCDGTPTTSTSACSAASWRSEVARSFGESRRSPR